MVRALPPRAPVLSPCSLIAFASALIGTATVQRARGVEPEPPTVVVQGDRPQPGAPPKAPHVSGSVIGRERLEQPGLTAAEALRDQPGVQIAELGGFGAPATATLRGATASQTPVYLGGVRINDEVGGAANLSDIPLFLIDRVEVYRSHPPLLRGEPGIGGALFFEPRSPEQRDTRLGGLAGSYGSRSAFGYASRGDRDAGLLAGVELAAANNYFSFWNSGGTLFDSRDDRDTRLSNADATTRTVWVVGSERLGAARLRFFYNHADREQGAPKLALTPAKSARYAFTRDLFALRSLLPVESWKGSAELVTSLLVGASNIDDPARELSLVTPSTSTPGERFEQNAVLKQTLSSNVKLAQGFTFSEERLRRFELQQGLPAETLAAERLIARLAVAAEARVAGPLSADATLAYTEFGTADTGSPRFTDGTPSGRVGLNLRGRESEIYVAAGRYERLPTLGELYGASLLVRGNPHLAVERGTSVEAGARQELRSNHRRLAWLDVAAFARYSSDLIVYVTTAQGYLHPLNRDRSRTLGAELTVGAAPLDFVDASASASVLDPRDLSPDRATANDILPFLSRLTAAFALSARADLGSRPIDSLSAGVRATYQSSRYANPAGAGVIPEQSSVDLELEAAALHRTVVARLRTVNLFDSRRFDVVGYPLPGRSVFLSMEAKL
jgi:iron complex outermembrane receptor protein